MTASGVQFTQIDTLYKVNMDNKRITNYVDDEEEKRKPTTVRNAEQVRNSTEDYEDDPSIMDEQDLLLNGSASGTGSAHKEISAPYEIPHYPIEVEEQRKIVQQHLSEMTLNVIGRQFVINNLNQIFEFTSMQATYIHT